MLAWGLMAEGTYVGPFRGPGATSDIPMRDGRFRRKVAAFRTDVSNWGWSLADNTPYRDLERLINPDAWPRFQERYEKLQRSALSVGST